ncbi:LysE family translocator [Nocardiopsis potens]|uniref:LysE family translocator n=1 Tax=Nocardiopsis potens TaxID=1246458 RepID=UPI00034B7230|nr:LysE family translocator [Nocardiopsis potens]
MSIEFLLTSLIVVATPGTGALFTMAAGLARGARASAVAALACAIGTLPHAAAALTGLAALLHTSALAFQVLKYLGVAYLLYMAWTMLRDRGAPAVPEDPRDEHRPVGRVIASGVLVNLLNPKLTIFFFAFLPQFADPAAPDALVRMAALSGVFTGLTLVVFLGYGVFAAAVRSFIAARPRALAWIRRSFAGAFAVLGVQLALASR